MIATQLKIANRREVFRYMRTKYLRTCEAHQIRTPTLYICKWSVWYRLQKITRNQE